MRIREVFEHTDRDFFLNEEEMEIEQKKLFKVLFDSLDPSQLHNISRSLGVEVLQEQEAIDTDALAEQTKDIRFRAFRRGDDFVLINSRKNKFESIWFNDFTVGEIKTYRNITGLDNAINELRAEGYQEIKSEDGIKSTIHLFYLRHRKWISPLFNPKRQIVTGGILLTIALMSFVFGFPPIGSTALEGSLATAGVVAMGRGWLGMAITPKRFWGKQNQKKR